MTAESHELVAQLNLLRETNHAQLTFLDSLVVSQMDAELPIIIAFLNVQRKQLTKLTAGINNLQKNLPHKETFESAAAKLEQAYQHLPGKDRLVTNTDATRVRIASAIAHRKEQSKELAAKILEKRELAEAHRLHWQAKQVRREQKQPPEQAASLAAVAAASMPMLKYQRHFFSAERAQDLLILLTKLQELYQTYEMQEKRDVYIYRHAFACILLKFFALAQSAGVKGVASRIRNALHYQTLNGSGLH